MRIILILTIFIAFFINPFTANTLTTVNVPQPEPETVKEFAERRVTETFGTGQWKYFDKIVIKESNWNNEAQNPESTAFGLMQFLNSTWSIVGCKKTTDAYTQIDCGITYIKQRYNTPQVAWRFHLQNNWY